MNKTVLVSFVSACVFNPVLYAGAMGAPNCAPSAFGSIEGGYTWNKIDSLELATGPTTFSIDKKESPYSFRLAAGVISMMDDELGFTGELGWGYYGSTTFDFPVISPGYPFSASSKYTLSGFDVLVGTAYVQTYYSLSLKVGGLIQNMQHKSTMTVDDTLGALGIPTVYTFTEKRNYTAVLPAVKLGAAYNVDSNWSITGSWLFAFGGTTGTTINFTPAAVNNFAVDVNSQNPMTNTFMLGIQYSA